METPNFAALRRAIEICGSQRALADRLQISPVAVGQWLLDTDDKNHRDVPPKRCVLIEGITQGRVCRRELRPHDWRDWWPLDGGVGGGDAAELVESEQNQPAALTGKALVAINCEAKEAAHV